MKHTILILALALCACQSTKPHVDGLAAVRSYVDHDFEQSAHQTGGGVQVNLAGRDGLGLEVAYIVTSDTTHDDDYVNRSTDYTKQSTRELSVGLRKAWMIGEHVQPFISGGIALSMTKTEVGLDYDEPVSDRGSSYAPYAQVGLNYLFNERWSAGLSYRRVFWGEDTDAFSVDPSSDSNTVLFALGYSF